MRESIDENGEKRARVQILFSIRKFFFFSPEMTNVRERKKKEIET